MDDEIEMDCLCDECDEGLISDSERKIGYCMDCQESGCNL